MQLRSLTTLHVSFFGCKSHYGDGGTGWPPTYTFCCLRCKKNCSRCKVFAFRAATPACRPAIFTGRPDVFASRTTTPACRPIFTGPPDRLLFYYVTISFSPVDQTFLHLGPPPLHVGPPFSPVGRTVASPRVVFACRTANLHVGSRFACRPNVSLA